MKTPSLDQTLTDFKQSLKQWLNDNELSTSWLASNLDKAEGTVKNWLYNPSINITESNKRDIVRILHTHTQGGEGLKYPRDEELNTLSGYIFSLNDYGTCGRYYVDLEGNEVTGKNNPWKHLDDWVNCAGTPIENTEEGRELTSQQLVTLAIWVTSTVMGKVKQVIKEVRDAQGEAFNVLTYKKDGKGKIDIDSFTSGYNSNYMIKRGNCLALPVVKLKWNSYYLEVAAAIKEVSTFEFVAMALNEATGDMTTKNLDAFLNDDYSTPQDAFITKSRRRDDDDDIPF